MALEFRIFKAASSGARFTTRVKNTVQRALEHVPSPTFESFRAAFTRPKDERATKLTANLKAPSAIGAAPRYPATTSTQPPPDLAAAIRAERAKGKK